MRDGEMDGARRLINRELSWIDFNGRVLALGADDNVPLIERLKFCGIWSSNLDEFFQVRVAGLTDEVAAGGTRAPDGLTSREQLRAIHSQLVGQIADGYRVWNGVVAELAEQGIEICDIGALSPEDRKRLDERFTTDVFPILTPLAVDPGHPFPYISDLSSSLGVWVRDPESDIRRFARVKVPTEMLGRFVLVDDPTRESTRVVLLEDLIASNLDDLFPGMELLEHTVFRVTRNADLSIDEREVDDLMSALESELRERRFGSVVRLEMREGVSPETRQLLADELDIDDSLIYEIPGPLDLGSVGSLPVEDRPELRYQKWSPVTPRVLGDGDEAFNDFFGVMRQRDVLVHHPYVSFDSTVLEFLRQASVDPAVLAIKITLYRTSGDGRIVKSLIKAAEAGKQVVVVVELKARFDEEANIAWARRLERAGVHVTYGLAGLKVHSKVALVVRQEPEGLSRYCHIGTGNYNSKTARLYTDVGLLTSDHTIGVDLSNLFNSLTGYGTSPDYERLIVAPDHMRRRLVELIDNEAVHGQKGRIVAKMNSLVDPEMIEAFYAASAAGVSIDLIVRGTCCLRPGVAGLSENIRVRSIVGRYLEHSRIYFFANGEGPDVPLYLIGSADLMPRNLNRRVEALVPVSYPGRQDEIELMLGVNLADDTTAWELGPDDQWRRVVGTQGIATHARLQNLTR